ncbi:hypothetical protein JCM6882_007406 [Rhodosporidiobolus microsporus]
MPVTRRQAAQQHTQETRHQTESLSSTLVGGDSEASHDSEASPVLAEAALVEEGDSSSDSGSSSDDSDSDSTDSDSDSTASSGPDLSALLLKAKQAARLRAEKEKERKLGKRGGEGDGLAGNEEVVRFGGESDEEESDDEEEEGDGATPKASTSRASSSRPVSLPPSLSRPLSFSTRAAFPSTRALPSSQKITQDGVSLAQDLGGVLVRGSEEVRVVPALGSKGKAKEVDRFGQAPLPKLSKKEIRAKQPHTAGPQWFNLPATPMTAELKRDLDALRLSNALDPKKFMRGGAKKEKVGEFFQVGHIIAPSTRASSLSSAPASKKRSFADDILASDTQLAYAKRKTKEVLAKGMSGRKRQRAKGAGRGSYSMGQGGGKGGGEGGGKRRKL